MASESDLFVDLIMLVVPKIAAERARWKYDVQDQDKRLTVYRLRYENGAATVSDCLSLQLCCHPSNPLGYSLIPTFFTASPSAHHKDPSSVPDVLIKEVLTSPLEIQVLLDQLDQNYEERYRRHDAEDVSHHCHLEEAAVTHWPKSGSILPQAHVDAAKPHRKQATVNCAVYASRSKRPEERDMERGSKRQKTMSTASLSSAAPTPPPPPPVRVEIWKNGQQVADEEKTRLEATRRVKGESQEKKVRKKGPYGALASLKVLLSDMPPLAIHPLCGGTIYSSQYWTRSADTRQRLHCSSKEIFVEMDIVHSLPDLRKTSGQRRFDDSVKFGWQLLQHLLGGQQAISRSFLYSSTQTSPITRQEVLDHVRQLCDGVIGR